MRGSWSRGSVEEPILLAAWVAMLLLALAVIALAGRPPRAVADALTVFAAALLAMNASRFSATTRPSPRRRSSRSG